MDTMYARLPVWFVLCNAALVVGCGTRPAAPRPELGAAPSARPNPQPLTPRDPAVEWERPGLGNGSYADKGSYADNTPSRGAANDPDTIRKWVTKETQRYGPAPATPGISPTPPKSRPRITPDATAEDPRNPSGSSNTGRRPLPQPPYGGARSAGEKIAPQQKPDDPAHREIIEVLPPPGQRTSDPAPPREDGSASRNLQGHVVTAVTSDADVLMRTYRKKIQDNPHDLQAHLRYQLLRLVKNEPVPDMETLALLPQEDREFLTVLLDSFSNLGPVLQDSGGTFRRTRVLMEMVERLRNQAELTLPTLALCSKVSGFGVYEPMTTHFRAGTDHPVIVYCEVENFLSKLNERQMWETKLSLEVVLYTLDGVAIWTDGRNPVPPDVSRNRRHDFFVIKHMTLPRTLGLGRFVLKVTVVDENARRLAEKNIEITMTAQ
jgi:hypothetical protein